MNQQRVPAESVYGRISLTSKMHTPFALPELRSKGNALKPDRRLLRPHRERQSTDYQQWPKVVQIVVHKLMQIKSNKQKLTVAKLSLKN